MNCADNVVRIDQPTNRLSMTDTTPRTPTSPRRLIERLRGEKPTTQAGVHFHNGPHGTPAVCDNPRCASPRLEV
jgi:hypothetical protein